MRDYKVYLPHHHQFEPIEDRISLLLAIVVLVLLIGLLCWSCVDGLVKTAEIQDKFYSKPVTATYDRPAAYRLQTPTADQMDHVDALLTVQQVAR